MFLCKKLFAYHNNYYDFSLRVHFLYCRTVVNQISLKIKYFINMYTTYTYIQNNINNNKQRALKPYAALYCEISRFVFVNNWSHRYLKIKYFINIHINKIFDMYNIWYVYILIKYLIFRCLWNQLTNTNRNIS